MGELPLGCYQREGFFFSLSLGLRNVASGQMPSPDMLYITFQFKCPLYSYVLCVFWSKLSELEFLFFPDIYPGVELVDHMVVLFLVFNGTSIMFSIVAAPI